MLNDAKARNAKPGDRAYKLYDAKGLFLLVNPNGSKWWRFRYRHGRRERTLSMGVYPEVGLAVARQRRDEARRQLAEGIDPSAARKAEKAKGTFRELAREWLEKRQHNLAQGTVAAIWQRLQNHALPYLGDRQPDTITPADVLAVLRRLEQRGSLETASKVRQYIGQVFRYGVASGQAKGDPTGALKGAIASPKVTHRATITDREGVGALLRSLEGFQGTFVVGCALRLLPLLLVRPGELRKAEWCEFDLDAARWKIPADKMKQGRPHIVPLSDQALAILADLQPLTGRGRYVFPSIRTSDRPLSENTLNAALRRLGYAREQMTAHGFRAMGSTLLNELGYPPDHIERQLAHVEGNAVRAAYNHAQHLAERERMMQAWADYLDTLKGGAEVVPIYKREA